MLERREAETSISFSACLRKPCVPEKGRIAERTSEEFKTRRSTWYLFDKTTESLSAVGNKEGR